MRKRVQLTPHLTIVDTRDGSPGLVTRSESTAPEGPVTEVCRMEGVAPIGEEFATAVLARFAADTGKTPSRVIFGPNHHVIFELADGTRHVARIRHAGPPEGTVAS